MDLAKVSVEQQRGMAAWANQIISQSRDPQAWHATSAQLTFLQSRSLSFNDGFLPGIFAWYKSLCQCTRHPFPKYIERQTARSERKSRNEAAANIWPNPSWTSPIYCSFISQLTRLAFRSHFALLWLIFHCVYHHDNRVKVATWGLCSREPASAFNKVHPPRASRRATGWCVQYMWWS